METNYPSNAVGIVLLRHAVFHKILKQQQKLNLFIVHPSKNQIVLKQMDVHGTIRNVLILLVVHLSN